MTIASFEACYSLQKELTSTESRKEKRAIVQKWMKLCLPVFACCWYSGDDWGDITGQFNLIEEMIDENIEENCEKFLDMDTMDTMDIFDFLNLLRKQPCFIDPEAAITFLASWCALYPQYTMWMKPIINKNKNELQKLLGKQVSWFTIETAMEKCYSELLEDSSQLHSV